MDNAIIVFESFPPTDPKIAEKVNDVLKQNKAVNIDTPYRNVPEIPQELMKVIGKIPQSLIDQKTGNFISGKSDRVSYHRMWTTILGPTAVAAGIGARFFLLPGAVVGAGVGLVAGLATAAMMSGREMELNTNIRGELNIHIFPPK